MYFFLFTGGIAHFFNIQFLIFIYHGEIIDSPVSEIFIYVYKA